jgi:hypothetical protein
MRFYYPEVFYAFVTKVNLSKLWFKLPTLYAESTWHSCLEDCSVSRLSFSCSIGRGSASSENPSCLAKFSGLNDDPCWSSRWFLLAKGWAKTEYFTIANTERIDYSCPGGGKHVYYWREVANKGNLLDPKVVLRLKPDPQTVQRLRTQPKRSLSPQHELKSTCHLHVVYSLKMKLIQLFYVEMRIPEIVKFKPKKGLTPPHHYYI